MARNAYIAFFSLCGISFFATNAVFADTAISSKCVTAATKATHANVLAQMEKDIAPYGKTAGAQVAIKKYADGLETAWDAMNEPYCGYGSYGNASAVKSYSKSFNRVRTAFLAEVKGLLKTAAQPTAAQTVPDRKQPEAPKKPQSAPIPSGLKLGMRSQDVTRLQQKLAAYFKIAADTSIVTGYFGPKTEALVIKFQLERTLIASRKSAGAGRVGLKTAKELNAL